MYTQRTFAVVTSTHSALLQNHKTLKRDLAVMLVFLQTQHKVMSQAKWLSGLFPPR